MPDKDLLEVNISKILPAPKWKAMRLVTQAEKFPTYIPCVKEVSIIQKTRNIIKTKWHVQVDNVPIKWVEEDTLALRQNTVYFKAVEGDLEEFRGTWTFQEHPEGTKVTVNVYLNVGIPVIKDFTDDYMRKLVARIFEAILEALEQRLISVRYASYKRGDTEKIAGFGLIGHPYNFNHLVKYFKSLNSDFKLPSREFLGQLFLTTPAFKVCDILNFKSKTGQTINGHLIMVTFIPDMLEKDPWAIFSKVAKACKIAEKYGVGIVGLGGFSSRAAERIGSRITDQVDVPVTSGNSFVSAMAIDGVLKAAGLLNLDIGRAKVAIVGGTGDVGSACARVLVNKAKQLIIAERTKANLKMLAKLVKRPKAQIIGITDNELAVKDADIVIASASVSASILKVDWFKPGAIICDVGYPKNIAYTVTNRKDIFIFAGGLAKLPAPISFPFEIGLPAPDTLYGCFSETIILALERRYENFTFGRGNITPERIDEIRNLGKKHGFEVADFYWGNKLIDEGIIGGVRELIANKK